MKNDVGALPWLAPGAPFPDTRHALDDPNGLLAIGSDLRPATLLRAYRAGIFPWFSDDQPILWWSPSPRLILAPGDFHYSTSLRKLLRRDRFRFSIDQAFTKVVQACALVPRDGQAGTWITDDMRVAYAQLHRLGHAHSIEVWHADELVGGLYGIHIGRMFFGESMFSLSANASKAALALLCLLQPAHGIDLIDCQMETSHLMSLGAHSVPRARFEQALRERVGAPNDWSWPHAPAALAEYARRYRLESTLAGQRVLHPTAHTGPD